jgi:hypothetical protein
MNRGTLNGSEADETERHLVRERCDGLGDIDCLRQYIDGRLVHAPAWWMSRCAHASLHLLPRKWCRAELPPMFARQQHMSEEVLDSACTIETVQLGRSNTTQFAVTATRPMFRCSVCNTST